MKRIVLAISGGVVLLSTVALLTLSAKTATGDFEMTPLTRNLTNEGFELLDTKSGVKVYQDKDAADIRLAGEGYIKGTPSEVFQAVTDYKAQDGQVERVVETRVLSRKKNALTVYQHLDLPFIDDRDFVLAVSWDKSKPTKWVAFRALKDATVPEKDGIVRVTMHNGSWQIAPSTKGEGSFVRFQTHIDLGGLLPMWMAKMGAGKEIPKLYDNIRSLVEKHRK